MGAEPMVLDDDDDDDDDDDVESNLCPTYVSARRI